MDLRTSWVLLKETTANNISTSTSLSGNRLPDGLIPCHVVFEIKSMTSVITTKWPALLVWSSRAKFVILPVHFDTFSRETLSNLLVSTNSLPALTMTFYPRTVIDTTAQPVPHAKLTVVICFHLTGEPARYLRHKFRISSFVPLPIYRCLVGTSTHLDLSFTDALQKAYDLISLSYGLIEWL